MSEEQKPTDAQHLSNLREIRELFAKAHDYIAQANHPGHRAEDIMKVLAFLKFQYESFKMQVERLEKQMENKVDVEAAKAATQAVLAPETAQEAPKA